MKHFIFLSLLLLLGTSCVTAVEVVSLTKETFDAGVRKTDLTLVKFFAPWCGHCQKLAPEYEKAAQVLGTTATLAEVDCTKDQEICSQFAVSGYPTIIFFRNGEEHSKYQGGRTSQAIVDFITSQNGPAVKTISSEDDLNALKVAGKTIALLVASSAESDVVKQFTEIADKQRLFFTFVVTTEKSVAPDAPQDKVVVLRREEKEIYEGDGSKESIEKFLKVARLPFIGEISPDTVGLYSEFFSTGAEAFPNGWIMLEKNEPELLASLTAAASSRRDRIVLLWADVMKYTGVPSHVGLPHDAKYPAFAVQIKNNHYVMPIGTPLTSESVGMFIDQALAGLVESTIRSEPVPEVETVNGLTTLVGDTFPKYLHEKDLLILFYAPWCGHCKSFKPVYADFAKEMESTTLVVAQFDATANDYDKDLFNVAGFPTLYLVPAKGSPIEYSGDRSIESLKSFVEEHMKPSEQGTNDDKSDL